MKPLILIFLLFLLIMPTVFAGSTVASTAVITSVIIASNSVHVARMRDKNCLVEKLPVTGCPDYEKVSQCEYQCRLPDGIATFDISYNDGTVYADYMTYQEIAERNKMIDDIGTFAIVVLIVLLGSFSIGFLFKIIDDAE